MLVTSTDTSPSRTTDNASVTTLMLPHQRPTREDLMVNVIKEEWDKVDLGEMQSI